MLAWLSHIRQQSTISRMGVSGATLCTCWRKAQLSWPAINRSLTCIMRSVQCDPCPQRLWQPVSLTLWQKLTDPLFPSGPSSQTDVDSPLTVSAPTSPVRVAHLASGTSRATFNALPLHSPSLRCETSR